jgi:hypothetical protein
MQTGQNSFSPAAENFDPQAPQIRISRYCCKSGRFIWFLARDLGRPDS